MGNTLGASQLNSSTKADRIVLGFLVFVLTGSVLFFTTTPGPSKFSYVEGNTQYQVFIGICYAMAGLIALAHFRETLSVALRSKSLVALIALTILSPIWAQEHALAFRHALGAFGTTLVGILLASRLDSRERLLLIRRILRTLAVASLFIAVLIPSRGVEAMDPLHIGDWTGIYGNKNRLGAFVAIPFLMDIFTPMRLRERVFWGGLYLILLFKSGSVSPLVALVVTGFLVQLLRRLRTHHKFTVKAIVILTFGTISLIVFGTFGTGFLPLILGRQTDLSGRTGLWKALIPAILQHPLLGYGYDAFWAGASDEYYMVERQLYWSPMYAHNGYFEVMVSLGLVGLALSLLFMARGGVWAFLEANSQKVKEGVGNSFPLALLIFYLIRNITECTIMIANTLEWAILVAVLLGVIPDLGSQRQLSSYEIAPEQLTPADEYA